MMIAHMPIRIIDVPPQSINSILEALQDAIDERVLAEVAVGDYPARKLAILELVRLDSWPDGPEKRTRMNALIREFGKSEVDRWQSFIDEAGR